MSVFIQLHLQGRAVLIVGGGAVATAKARQYLDAGAALTVLAPEISGEIERLPSCRLLRRRYAAADLAGCFLVYAATNDQALNQRIVHDAAQNNILAGSASRAAGVSFSSTRSGAAQGIAYALSSGGAYPALLAGVEADIRALLDAHYAGRLALLAAARVRILAWALPGEQAHGLLRALAGLPLAELSACLEKDDAQLLADWAEKEKIGRDTVQGEA